jgi:hypothetical protein
MARGGKGLKQRKGADPVYAVEDGATGLYLNLDGDKPQPVEFDEATTFPATLDGRSAAVRRLSLSAIAAPYDLVRIDA